MMKLLGYSSGWINMIKECVITTSFSILINAQRGLKQSEPISPFFFILSAKLISRIIARLEIQGNFEGILLIRNNPPISHLLFKDVLVIFQKANKKNAQTISESLEKYQD